MAHKWRDIRHKLSPEQEEEIRRRVEMAPVIMRLHQVREARNLTQTKLAKVLKVNQGAVSKLERRTDMYVSTLRAYLEAIGGELEIKAVFPDGEVIIDQFERLAEDRDGSAA